MVWQQQPGPMSAPVGHPWIPDSVKALRKDFEVASPIRSARLYATALGGYELFLNGKRVGDDVLAPGWTDYRAHVKYQTYDVTALISQPGTTIGALLAPGWYSTPLEWFQQPNNYGVTAPALRAQLRIEHADGSVEWVTTDGRWKASTSNILHSELYDGESQDARLVQDGWSKHWRVWRGLAQCDGRTPGPRHHRGAGLPIHSRRAHARVKNDDRAEAWRVCLRLRAELLRRRALRISGPRGTDVRLRFAEILNSDGTLYTDNLRTAKATDHFILAGDGVEEFTPQFTFHGFRYTEITGLPAAPAKDAVSALVFHTDAPFTARLETGSPMINQLWSNILWGQRSNFVGIPTDCPQRDERLGWMADAQVFWRAASYNMELAAFSRKFAGDMRGTQVGTPYYGIYSPGTAKPNMGTGAGWSDAGVIIPWTSWLQTGDTSMIEQNWAAMDKYLDAIDAANPDGLWTQRVGNSVWRLALA